jgi:phosphohistidine phosphatase
MRLYLVQHAAAKSKEEDPSRPLSAEGSKAIRNVAEYARKYLPIQVIKIFHSGKLRADQTAEILAAQLRPAKGVWMAKDLEPLADPKIWKNRLAEAADDIMLVGHLPHLQKLTSYLLTGDEHKQVVTFRNAGILCLERGDRGGWAIRWAITPELLP